MALPDLIEIVPMDRPLRAVITVPGSKSITNRALVLAALADGETTLEGALWSEDTEIMVECLQELGFMVNVQPDPNEACNRRITVYGKGASVPPGGTEERPLELFVGNAGTAARFMSAFVCLGRGVYRLHGVDRMNERPQAALFAALRELGYEVQAEKQNEKLPVRITVARPGTPQAGSRSCHVSIEESSQFASALLLCANAGGWRVEISGENAEESPYVAMTSELIKTFPRPGGVFQIEPDASSGSYFLAAARLAPFDRRAEYSRVSAAEATARHTRTISVRNWPSSGWQVDERFPAVIGSAEALDYGLDVSTGSSDSFDGEQAAAQQSTKSRQSVKEAKISRVEDLGDSIMTATVLAPFSLAPVRFTELGRLRHQECNRVLALRTELSKCGVKVIEEGDTLCVYPSQPHGAEIETYDDHRMAMCFATLGLKVPGIKLKNSACVKKTFPNFFQKLAEPPQNGLGIAIRDGTTGRVLTHDELFAD
jgi:3-phosphoshikimate 1-carboxyvinyltransferase